MIGESDSECLYGKNMTVAFIISYIHSSMESSCMYANLTRHLFYLNSWRVGEYEAVLHIIIL